MIKILIILAIIFAVIMIIGASFMIINFIRMARYHKQFMSGIDRDMKKQEKEQSEMHKRFKEHQKKNDEFFKKFGM